MQHKHKGNHRAHVVCHNVATHCHNETIHNQIKTKMLKVLPAKGKESARAAAFSSETMPAGGQRDNRVKVLQR